MLDSLGRAIVTGRYEREAFPTEAELAKQHGVSRSVTREAVKMLTAKGLLSARPRQGTVVQPRDQLEPVRHRRAALAARAAILDRPAAPVQPAPRRDRARSRVARRTRRRRRRTLPAISPASSGWKPPSRASSDTLEADIAFHVAILRASGNPFYAQFRDVVAHRAAHLDPLHQPDRRAAPPMSPITPRCATPSKHATPTPRTPRCGR